MFENLKLSECTVLLFFFLVIFLVLENQLKPLSFDFHLGFYKFSEL